MGDIIIVNRKDGTASYKARIRRRGERFLTKTFRRKSEAQKWINLTESRLLEGKNLPKPRRHTINQAVARYLEEVLPHKKINTQYVQRSMVEFWGTFLDGKRLAEISYDDLQQAKDFLKNTPVPRVGFKKPQMRGPATINRYFAVLSHIFSVVIRDWEWVDHNPVARMRSLPEPRGRQRALTDDELSTILNALESHPREDFKIIVHIALTTGCRRGNAESIHWEHIDFERRTITFPDTKNNAPHVTPITQELCTLLRQYRSKTARMKGPAFPSRDGSDSAYVDVKQVWRRFTKQLGILDLRFHDLRHAVATFLAQQNVSLLSIGRVLGHKSLESTKRYAHMGVSDVEPHIEDLGKRMRRVK